MLRLMQMTLHSALLLLGAALASIPTAPSAVLLENDEVKVVRALEKNQVVGKFHQHEMNEHSTDRVTVFLTDQNFQTKDSAGKVATVEHKAGDVAWGTPIEHSEQNLSDQPFEAVSVELDR